MKMTSHIDFYQKAPDLNLITEQGDEVAISAFWQEKPLLLAFTRHFGCTQCKEMINELLEGKQKIEKAGLNILIVSQGTPEATAIFSKEYAPDLTFVCDPDREAYAAYGLERGNLFQTFLNPKVWSAVSAARKKGMRVDRPPKGQDAMQMSGTFVISTKGYIMLPYYYDHIADHPPLDLILSGVLGTDWSHPFEGPVGPGMQE
ncbi:MAG: AhpC/TSA family protein [Anaerolineales bacterium]|nr:AhpC/TSA family protein [Anaerolineales bacterium]